MMSSPLPVPNGRGQYYMGCYRRMSMHAMHITNYYSTHKKIF